MLKEKFMKFKFIQSLIVIFMIFVLMTDSTHTSYAKDLHKMNDSTESIIDIIDEATYDNVEREAIYILNDENYINYGFDQKVEISEDAISIKSEDLELLYQVKNDNEDCFTTEIEDDIVVMSNVTENYMFTTEIFEGAVRNCFIIDENCEINKFAIEYDLPEGAYFEFAKDELDNYNEDGSILIVDKTGEYIGAIAKPWAKDSEGNDVETYYEIEDNIIYQIVDYNDGNYSFPIVADPTLTFDSCFSEGKWITRNGVVSLSLTPNLILRLAMLQGSTSMRKYSWEAVVSEFSSSSKWKNTQSMKNQYLCHWYLAIVKTSFNLEPSRPVVSWVKMIGSLCNP